MLYENFFLKNFLISTGNTCVGSSLEKVTCNFIKKRPQHRCFPLNIAKFLRLPILKNICGRLFVYCFDSSLLHGTKSSRYRLYGSISLQCLSHRSRIFVFKLVSLVLNQVTTCVLKSRMNTFLYELFLVALDGFRSFFRLF